MDRLPALVIASLGVLACDDGPSANAGAEVPKGRVDAVLTRTHKKSWSDLCDATRDPAGEFHWPELDSPPHDQSRSRYRWINVWASWCKPCVEELPLLTQTMTRWQDQGESVALTLLSVDADAESAQRFLAERPELPTSLRLKDAATAPSWLTELGLSAGTSIPVHIVLDAQDRLLCARAGAIGTRDLEHFHGLLFP